MRKRARFDTEQVLEALVWLLILGSALMIGAVHPPVLAGTAVVAVAFGAVVFVRSGAKFRSRPEAILATCLVGAGFWAVIQTLPLGGLAAVLSPQSADLWSATEQLTRISGNLLATRAMAVKCLASAVLLVGAVTYFYRSDHSSRVVEIIIASTAIVAIVAFVQAALHLDRLLFVYEPQMGPVREGLRGPFVNPDHFGAYMAVGSLLALSQGFTIPISRRRFVFYGAAIPLVAALFLSLSLSAWLGFAAGISALGILWWRKHRRFADVLGVVVPMVAVGAFIALLAVYYGLLSEPVLALSEQVADLGRRVSIGAATMSVFKGSWLVGAGSGSLADLLTPHLDAPATSVWFARNQVIQLLVDFGLIVGAALLVGLVWALLAVRRTWARVELPAVAPPIVALSALAVISMVDFALEIPAIGITGLFLLAALLSRIDPMSRRSPNGEAGRSARRRRRRPLLTAAALGVPIVCVLISAWMVDSHLQVARATAVLSAGGPDAEWSDEDVEALEVAGLALLEIRPGWGRVYTSMGRAHLLAGDDEEALRWLQAATELLPTDVVTLRLTGATHLRRGDTEQAVLAFREASRVAPASIAGTFELMVHETPRVDLWVTVAADESLRSALMDWLFEANRAVDALRLAEALLDEDAQSRIGLEGASRASLALGIDELASSYGQRLIERYPTNTRAAAVLARLDLRAGNLEAAHQRIETALEDQGDDPILWFALGDVLLARAEDGADVPNLAQRMRVVRNRLRPVALSQPRLRADFHSLSARFYIAIQEWRAAVSAARHGLGVDSVTPRFYELLGLALFELGEVADAENALRQALLLGSTDEHVRRALGAIREQTSDPSDVRVNHSGNERETRP